MVECFLAKEDVAGSTPVSRSNNLLLFRLSKPCTEFRIQVFCARLSKRCLGLVCNPGARYPSGKGEVCKTFMRRFDPDPRLQYSPNKIKQVSRLSLICTDVHRCVFWSLFFSFLHFASVFVQGADQKRTEGSSHRTSKTPV